MQVAEDPVLQIDDDADNEDLKEMKDMEAGAEAGSAKKQKSPPFKKESSLKMPKELSNLNAESVMQDVKDE